MKTVKERLIKGQTAEYDKIDEIFLKEKKELRRLEWVKARKEAGVERFHKWKRIWDDGTADEMNEEEDTNKKKPK